MLPAALRHRIRRGRRQENCAVARDNGHVIVIAACRRLGNSSDLLQYDSCQPVSPLAAEVIEEVRHGRVRCQTPSRCQRRRVAPATGYRRRLGFA